MPRKPGDDRPFNDAFAGLKALAPELPAGPAPTTAPAPKAPARAVVRLERKGRGGKEATLVEKLELRPTELERWLSDMKRALGCGGAVEGEALALQGDQRKRAKRWLEERGVRRVSVG